MLRLVRGTQLPLDHEEVRSRDSVVSVLDELKQGVALDDVGAVIRSKFLVTLFSLIMIPQIRMTKATFGSPGM